MKRCVAVACVSFIFSLFATNSFAGIVNGGFESGLTGWTGGSDFPNFSSEGTNLFAWVGESGDGSKEGTHYLVLNNGLVFPTTWLFQDVYLNVGETISGYAAFHGGYESAAYVSIGSNQVWQASGTFDGVSIPWTKWQWTAPQSGLYRVQLTLYDLYGCGLPGALYDGITVDAVPIPAAIWLMGSSLVGLLRLRKKIHLICQDSIGVGLES